MMTRTMVDSLIYSEPDFISNLERIRIRNSVMALRSRWQMVKNVDNIGYVKVKKTFFYLLGDSVYHLESNDLTLEAISKRTKLILKQEFGWIYDRIFKKVEQLTGKKVELFKGVTVPGFHISEVPIFYSPERLHIDSSITHYFPEVNMDTIHSVLLLIEKPSGGAWLDYQDKDGNNLKKNYEYGAFNMWKSDMPHKIGGFRTLPGEHRITLQMHYCADPNNKNKLLAYF